MPLTLNAEPLRELIKAFYGVTGVKLAVYDADFREIIAYPAERSPFCTLLRSSPAAEAACDRSDAVMCRQCAEQDRIVIHTCHAGLTEVVAPLKSEGEVIGYVMYGQITNQPDRTALNAEVLRRCRAYGFTDAALTERLAMTVQCTNEQLEAMSLIMNALASYIVLKQYAYPAQRPLAFAVREYIGAHLAEPLSVQSLCEQFYVSKTELYAATRESMPQGVAAYIAQRRIEKARELLRTTDLPLWRIAELVGYPDKDYFLRKFKRATGVSAGSLRK